MIEPAAYSATTSRGTGAWLSGCISQRKALHGQFRQKTCASDPPATGCHFPPAACGRTGILGDVPVDQGHALRRDIQAEGFAGQRGVLASVLSKITSTASFTTGPVIVVVQIESKPVHVAGRQYPGWLFRNNLFPRSGAISASQSSLRVRGMRRRLLDRE